MQRADAYVGFPPLRKKSDLVNALLTDPVEIRWRVVRELFQIKDQTDREALINDLQECVARVTDPRIKSRIVLALQALHRSPQIVDYHLVRHRGAFKYSELEQLETMDRQRSMPPFLPIIDFHIHPQNADLDFFADMRTAGITHGVILATDTDPADVERPQVRRQLQQAFKKASAHNRMGLESLLKHIKASLGSPTLVTNQDVADWVRDYPGLLTGFGSVNLSKDASYVRKTLATLKRLNLKGIKFVPHAQFFNPAENEHMDLVFDFCRQSGAIIITHAGCGSGPFEIIELSRNSNPILWEPWVKKYPDVPVVLAHFGAYSSEVSGIWLFEALQLGKKYPNVYADLSAVDWLLDREMVVKEIRKTIGFNRVLFASNYPVPTTSRVSWAYLVKGVQTNTHLTQKEKNKVLGQNASSLLGL